MTSPDRFYVRVKPNGALGDWHDATSSRETAEIAGGMVETIRLDAPPEVIATMPGAQVLLAAMIEAAGEKCHDRDKWNSPVSEAVARDVSLEIEAAIRALAPDALAWLARHDAEMRRQGMLEAARICRVEAENLPVDDHEGALACERAIRSAAAPADASGRKG